MASKPGKAEGRQGNHAGFFSAYRNLPRWLFSEPIWLFWQRKLGTCNSRGIKGEIFSRYFV